MQLVIQDCKSPQLDNLRRKIVQSRRDRIHKAQVLLHVYTTVSGSEISTYFNLISSFVNNK